MKVLSVRQPYAALLVTGQKRFEARTWTTPYRGQLLVHASSSAVTESTMASIEMEREFIEALGEAGWRTRESLRRLPRSAVVGAVNLVDVVASEECEDASDRDLVLSAEPDADTYFWRLADPIAIEPIPIDGKLKLWELPSQLDAAVALSLDRTNASSPAWRVPDNEGERLRLQEFSPSPQLAASIGSRPRCRRDIWNDLTAYVKLHQLGAGRTVTLDTKLALLSPGKPTVRWSTLARLVAQNIRLLS